MRLSPLVPFVLLSLSFGCSRTSTQTLPAFTSPNETLGPMPREVKGVDTPEPKPKKAPGDAGLKPISARSTRELLDEVEHPDTKDRLPLLAELARRPQDRLSIVPKMNLLQTNGVYAVRLAAANVAVAIDSENIGKHSTMVSAAIGFRYQAPVYGPLRESTPELVQIQKRAVPQLVKLIEKDLEEAKLHQKTLGCMAVLGTYPKDVGDPAVEVLQRVATTPAHPFAVQAKETLKKWGIG